MLSQSKIYKRVISGNPTRLDRAWLELLWDVFADLRKEELLIKDPQFMDFIGMIALHKRFKDDE